MQLRRPAPKNPTGPITGKTNTNAVNLRSKTSTESDAVARVPQGTEVIVVSQLQNGDKTWYQIEFEGKQAYVLASLIDVDGGRTVPAEGETPVEEPTVEPTDEPAATEEPVVEPVEQPSEEPTEAPVEEPTVEPGNNPTPIVIDPVIDTITDEPQTEEPVSLTEEPSEAPVETPTEPTEQPVEEPSAQPAEEPTEAPVVEPTQDPGVEEPVIDIPEEEQQRIIEENMRYLITLPADTTLYAAPVASDDSIAGTLSAGETCAANSAVAETATVETEDATVTYSYITWYSTLNEAGETVYFENPNAQAIADAAANATDANALVEALGDSVTDVQVVSKAAEQPEATEDPVVNAWVGQYTITLNAETALYAALSPVGEEGNAELDPYATGFYGEAQTGTLPAGETLTANVEKTRVATFLGSDGTGAICEFATWYVRQNEAGETEYFINGDLAAISAILSNEENADATIEALKPYCLSVKASEQEAKAEDAGKSIGALINKGVDLDDVTVSISVSPAKAQIGDTVTLSATISSPNGLDGIKLQWQHCILQIVNGVGTANWENAENGNEAVYSFKLTEETQRYTWQLLLSVEESAQDAE